jgi:hypothetical protein
VDYLFSWTDAASEHTNSEDYVFHLKLPCDFHLQIVFAVFTHETRWARSRAGTA